MKNRAVIGTLATAAVVALVVAGLFAVGSPATARKLKADQERRNRLNQIHYVLAGHVREQGALPRSLEEIDDEVLRQAGYGFDARRDPLTGEFFEYRRQSARTYEVCANFQTSSKDARSQEYGPFPGELEHEAGRTCFERRITDQDVESAPGFGVEGFPRRIPPRLAPSETTRPAGPEPTTEPTPEDPGAVGQPGPEPLVGLGLPAQNEVVIHGLVALEDRPNSDVRGDPAHEVAGSAVDESLQSPRCWKQWAASPPAAGLRASGSSRRPLRPELPNPGLPPSRTPRSTLGR